MRSLSGAQKTHTRLGSSVSKITSPKSDSRTFSTSSTHRGYFPVTIRVFQAEKKPKNQAKTRPKPGKSRSKPGAPGRASKTRSSQDAQKPGAYQEHQEQLTKPGVSGFSPQELATQNQPGHRLVMHGWYAQFAFGLVFQSSKPASIRL